MRVRWAVYTAILFASWNFNLLGLPDPDRFDRCRWRSGFLGCEANLPVLLPFAPSLYLGTVLHLAPFALAWCLYPRAATPRQQTRLVLGVGVLVGVKALCGYEYVTTVALAPLAAAWFHQHRAAAPWK